MSRPANDFFGMIVRPAIAEFATEPLSLRRACLAALVLNSMTDHYFADCPNLARKRGDFRDYISKLRTDLGLVRDVAEATKHAALRGDSHGLSFERIRHRSVEAVGGYGSGALAYNVSGAYAARPAIVVRNSDGSDSLVDEAIMSVLTFWEDKLASEPSEL